MLIDYTVAIVALAGVLALIALIMAGRAISARMHPPSYVSNITTGRVEIELNKGRVRSSLEASPYAGSLIVEPSGYLAVRFRDEGSPLDNEELRELLTWLRDQGLPFSVGKGWGPAEVMHHLWSHGRLKGRFKTIYWTGPGKWHVSDVYPGAA